MCVIEKWAGEDKKAGGRWQFMHTELTVRFLVFAISLSSGYFINVC